MKKTILFTLLLLMALPVIAQTDGLGTGDLINPTIRNLQWIDGLLGLIDIPLMIFYFIMWLVYVNKFGSFKRQYPTPNEEQMKEQKLLARKSKRYGWMTVITVIIFILINLFWAFLVFPVCC
ncbi:MAG: hypothetical protein Q8P20_10290 [bacterium]|nr:hypothetical protein [bacterium]